jgi:hypothetical protein
MSVTAYYVEAKASPINQKRSGTIRIGSDSPNPIMLNKGFANSIMFAFVDSNNHAVLLDGVEYSISLYNRHNSLLASSDLVAVADTPGLGRVSFSSGQIAMLEAGLYNLVISTRISNLLVPIKSSHGTIRFEIEVVDYIT